MKILCATCGEEISPARIALIKKCKECTRCAAEHDVERVRGYMTWEHKTAPTLVIASERAVNEFLGMTRRGPRPQLPFSPKGALESFANSSQRQDTANCVALEPELIRARCHPERRRASSDGKCLECVLEFYERRRKLYAATRGG